MRLVPDIASAQDGVFTRAQAAAAGISYARMRRLLAIGQWIPVLGPVYAAQGTVVGPRQTARALTLLTSAVVSHASAGTFYAIEAGGGHHVTVEPDRRLRVPGVTAHRLRLTSTDVVDWNGIRMTTRVRTVVDLLATLPFDRARTLQHRAVQQDWLRPDELITAAKDRVGWHGTPQLVRLIRETTVGAHSVLEVALHRVLRRAGIVGWEPNVQLHDASGLIGIVDVYFAACRLVIEVDGRRFHGDDRFQTDRTRQNRLVSAGCTVLRFTYDDLMRRPEHVVATIRRTLARLAA